MYKYRVAEFEPYGSVQVEKVMYLKLTKIVIGHLIAAPCSQSSEFLNH